MNKNRIRVPLFFLMFAFLIGTASAGNIVIKGSTTVLPIAQKAAEMYGRLHKDVNVSVSGGGSGNGIKAIVDGTCDVATSSRFVKGKEIKLACEKGVLLVPHRVALDCIVPVVHPSNPLDDISIETLRKIFRGKVKNWKDLGGPDKKIVTVSRDTSSGTYEVWSEKVMKKKRVFPGALLQASNGAVAQVVSKNKYAIGYVGIGYLNDTLKGLKVESVIATTDTVKSGAYPVSRPLFMFTNGWPEGDALNFMNFVLSAEGQQMVEQEGFVPVY